MSKKPYPALCRDCKHSVPADGSEWELKCHHPKVNANDPWALSSGVRVRGTSCQDQRAKKSFFALCGMRGKLWEPKDATPTTED
jgi:hypothetical protein